MKGNNHQLVLAYQVPLVTAVEAVVTNKDVRCDLIEKGKARAALYTWRRCADRTVEVYLEVAAAAAHGLRR